MYPFTRLPSFIHSFLSFIFLLFSFRFNHFRLLIHKFYRLFHQLHPPIRLPSFLHCFPSLLPSFSHSFIPFLYSFLISLIPSFLSFITILPRAVLPSFILSLHSFPSSSFFLSLVNHFRLLIHNFHHIHQLHASLPVPPSKNQDRRSKRSTRVAFNNKVSYLPISVSQERCQMPLLLSPHRHIFCSGIN